MKDTEVVYVRNALNTLREGGISPLEQCLYLTGYPVFNSFWFAVDTIVPIIDLNQTEHWTIVRPALEKRYTRTWWARSMFVILQIMGWVITTMIAISIGSRIETIVARSEEL